MKVMHNRHVPKIGSEYSNYIKYRYCPEAINAPNITTAKEINTYQEKAGDVMSLSTNASNESIFSSHRDKEKYSLSAGSKPSTYHIERYSQMNSRISSGRSEAQTIMLYNTKPENKMFANNEDFRPICSFLPSIENSRILSNVDTNCNVLPKYIKDVETPNYSYNNMNSKWSDRQCDVSRFQDQLGRHYTAERLNILHFDSNEPLDLSIKGSQFMHQNESSSSSRLNNDSYQQSCDSSIALDIYSPNNESPDWLKKISTGNRVRSPKSYEFLLRLLRDPNSNPSMIRWEEKSKGIFRLVRKEDIARIWGMRSKRSKECHLSYENFARNLRYHYKTEVMLPVSEKHLVYRFGDNILQRLKSESVESS